LRLALQERRGITLGVIITDTFGRPWRDGLVEFALGVSGFEPLLDLRGSTDMRGRELHHTVVAVADELAAAAGLVMEKGAGVPVVIVRGYQFTPAEGGSKTLIRPAEADLFR
jgi:coenzyme F420-0:L-glutamate ligase/coenzyme F420-1:gamma-L-glutamate ligase